MQKPYIITKLARTIKNYKGKEPNKLNWSETFELINCDKLIGNFGSFQYTLDKTDLYIYGVEYHD